MSYRILEPGPTGLERISVPGETLWYKVCGDDNDGLFDYLVLDVMPGSGPPLHIHHEQHETIHFLKGRFKVQAGDEARVVDAGGFLWAGPGVEHSFRNISGEPGQCVLTYTPGNSHDFFAEFGPAIRSFEGGEIDHGMIGAIFQRHTWEVTGPPLSPDVEGLPGA